MALRLELLDAECFETLSDRGVPHASDCLGSPSTLAVSGADLAGMRPQRQLVPANADTLTSHCGRLIRRQRHIHYHGLCDPLIVPFGSQNYVSRYARFPNAGLVNGTDLFAALVEWVEQGVARDYVVAYNTATDSAATVSRKICKYPNEPVYNGSGSTADQNNCHCVVHPQEPMDLKAYVETAPRYYEAP